MIDVAPRRPSPGEGTPQDDSAPSTGPLGRLGRIAYRARGRVVLGWLAVFALATGLSIAFGGEFTADYTAPGSDSRAAVQLLRDRFPAQSGETVEVVMRAEGGVGSTRSEIQALLAEVAAVAHVTSVEDPFQTPGRISADGRTLLAYARLDVILAADMPAADVTRLMSIADRADELPGIEVALGGEVIDQAERGEIGSEGIGLLAAAVILLLTFGSVVAAGLPIAVAVAGLAISGALTTLFIRFVDTPDWSTSLATMIGIGIGIDYALLMVTRFREWRAAGLDPEAATVATLDTAGRSVMVAGGTVLVSMFGLFAMGLSYMRGAAVVTMLAVFVVMAASATLVPALLGYLGRYLDRLRLPVGRTPRSGRVWLRWSNVIRRHRLLAAAAGIAVILALAAPFAGVRFGFPDAGNNGADTSTNRAYTILAAGFGAGANGPLVLAVQLSDPGHAAVLDRLRQAVATTAGVAAVAPAQLNASGDTAVLTVVPTTGPQDERTEALVRRLRESTIPQATAGSGATVRVGGVTAVAIDTTADIAERIPLLIAGVVLLSMLLLLVAFRSVAIAIKAAVMNLLSVAAAYGVVALVLRGGWAGQLIGIDTSTPLPAFVLVLMFAALFGLSMDYEVFLISRIRESWVRSGDNTAAVTEGLAGTGRVITAAAAIMIAVFAAFIPSSNLILKIIGVGMAAAILLDATVIRMLLVPALMYLLGKVTWWMPSGLGRVLPELHIEGRPQEYLDALRRRAPALAGAESGLS